MYKINVTPNKKLKLSTGYLVFIIYLANYSISFAQNINQKNITLLPSSTSEAVEFGAYSTHLKYTPEWDNLWPVSEISDVVVRFGNKEPRFVFWRGSSYIPCWATYDGAWFTNEFFERRGGATSGTISMVEPMSDKQCRYSNVRIIENNDARVIVHWRYAPTDLEYSMAYLDDETNWGDWADEYYILYPDAVGIRKSTLFTSALDEWIEYQESIVINQPGSFPENSLNYDAVTLLNLKGNAKTYFWTEEGAPKFENVPQEACIQKINFKSEYKPFTIVNPENFEVRSYGGHAPGSHFNFWDHWPVSQTKSHTRAAKSADQPSHTSLSSIRWNSSSETDNSRTWIMMHGMINSDDDNLVQLAASWIHPAELKFLAGNYIDEGYDKSQRAYVLTAADGAGTLNFELLADKNSPLVNPAFLIKNWGESNVNLKINDQVVERGDNFRAGHISNINGTDLIVWLKLTSDMSVKILIYK
ncbi:MAG TPA: hypothetical protein VMV77_21190 [Bacteroidales bacterium]|nr:hypothetical protein [Bacteroidales bacterium]